MNILNSSNFNLDLLGYCFYTMCHKFFLKWICIVGGHFVTQIKINYNFT